jgi:Fe-S-cluster formation regulator IscX/YfhJ
MPSKESKPKRLDQESPRETKRRIARESGRTLYEALDAHREIESRAASETRLRSVLKELEKIQDDSGLCKQFIEGVFNVWITDHPIRLTTLKQSKNPVSLPRQFGCYLTEHFDELQQVKGPHRVSPQIITEGLYHITKLSANTADTTHTDMVDGIREGIYSQLS